MVIRRFAVSLARLKHELWLDLFKQLAIMKNNYRRGHWVLPLREYCPICASGTLRLVPRRVQGRAHGAALRGGRRVQHPPPGAP